MGQAHGAPAGLQFGVLGANLGQQRVQRARYQQLLQLIQAGLAVQQAGQSGKTAIRARRAGQGKAWCVGVVHNSHISQVWAERRFGCGCRVGRGGVRQRVEGDAAVRVELGDKAHAPADLPVGPVGHAYEPAAQHECELFALRLHRALDDLTVFEVECPGS